MQITPFQLSWNRNEIREVLVIIEDIFDTIIIDYNGSHVIDIETISKINSILNELCKIKIFDRVCLNIPLGSNQYDVIDSDMTSS